MNRIRAAGKALAVAGGLVLVSESAVQAQTWWDPTFHAVGTSVTVRYMGSNAAYFNTMQWFQVPYASIAYHAVPGPNIVNYSALGGVTGGNYTNIFTNKDRSSATTAYLDAGTTIVNAGPKSVVGDEMTLSTLAGAEVLLGLFVNNESGAAPWATQDANDYTYFTGGLNLGRNTDGTFHLKVEKLTATSYAVYGGGWEDILNGGDEDFNDLLFEIEGVTVTPEPMTMTLLGTGLFGVAAAARRRRRKDDDTQV